MHQPIRIPGRTRPDTKPPLKPGAHQKVSYVSLHTVAVKISVRRKSRNFCSGQAFLFKADDITVSVIREARPEKLFQYFEEHGYIVTNSSEGIYYIKDKVLFSTQIIVTKELDGKSHKWLKALSGNLKKDDICELFRLA